MFRGKKKGEEPRRYKRLLEISREITANLDVEKEAIREIIQDIADFLEVEHHAGQPVRADFLPDAHVAYRIILAEHTPEVAMGEENGPAAVVPADGGLFPVMEVVARNHGVYTRLAEPDFPARPVDTATART